MLTICSELATFRSPAESEGELTMDPRTTIVVEPPPSKLNAWVAPSESMNEAISANVMPMLDAWRPSTVHM